MLFSTSLVVIVGRTPGGQRKLQILNTKRQSTICELSFPSDILTVRLNRRRLVVVLATSIYVYDISNLKLLHTIETGVTQDGLCALASVSDECYMVYATTHKLHDHNAGASSSVVVYNLHSLTMVNVIPAHRTRVVCLALNSNGTILATASEKGTVIRVFSIPDGRLMYQFRRGTYPARIFSMTFNAASTLLCVTSDSDTIHVFRLFVSINRPLSSTSDPKHALEQKRRSSLALASSWSPVSSTPTTSWRQRGLSMVHALGTYLPTSLAEMWEPTRDFAWFKLPKPGVRSVAVVSNSQPVVLVLTYEGLLYTYALDLDLGGECHLTKRTCYLHVPLCI